MAHTPTPKKNCSQGKSTASSLVVIATVAAILTGCGSSDLASLEQDTFFDQAFPKWLLPKVRDDYMGKRYLQPRNSAASAIRDEQGDWVADTPLWQWPRGFPWPWPLPNPSPGD